MNLTSKTIHFRKAIRGSFTLWDLIAILVVFIFAGAWYAVIHTGERGRIACCASNLRILGEATQSFADEHQSELPAAIINLGKTQIWDMALIPYLCPNLTNAKSIYAKNQLLSKAQHFFLCPSDTINRKSPRSYAMAGRDMSYGWPPTSGDDTGLGILWDNRTVSILHDEDLITKADKDFDLLPRIKQSLLLKPAGTLLITELVVPDNILAQPNSARVLAVNDQQTGMDLISTHFHSGKFNYLMADGHVELLAADQTDGSDGKSHTIWTVNQNN